LEEIGQRLHDVLADTACSCWLGRYTTRQRAAENRLARNVNRLAHVVELFGLDWDGESEMLKRVQNVYSEQDKGLALAINHIVELREEEADEESIAGPSDYALSTTIDILKEADSLLSFPLPRLTASTDGQGGIHTYWRGQEPVRKVELVIPGQANHPHYVYYRQGKGSSAAFAVETDVTGITLAHRLQGMQST